MSKTYAEYEAEYLKVIEECSHENPDSVRVVRPEIWILAKWEEDNGGWMPFEEEYHRELKRLVLADPPLAAALVAGLQLQLPLVGKTFEETFPEYAQAFEGIL